MKSYIGTKIIKAEPMDEQEFNEAHGDGNRDSTIPASEGYKVVYPDNYISWSPKGVFETAYREITDGELNIVSGSTENEKSS